MTRKISLLLIALIFTIWADTKFGAIKPAKAYFSEDQEVPLPEKGAMVWCTDGRPIGGCVGYTDTVPLKPGNQTSYFYATSSAHFWSIFNDSAGTNDTIYVAHDVSVDFTGTGLNEPAGTGMVIASGRGKPSGDTCAWGAIFHADGAFNHANDFFNPQSGTRFTGIRFHGPFSDIYGMPTSDSFDLLLDPGIRAIMCTGNNTQIDNCEIVGFSDYPLQISGADGCQVKYNWWHHGNMFYHGYGLGYTGAGISYDSCNWGDYHEPIIMSNGGTNGQAAKCYHNYSIYGPHLAQGALCHKATVDSVASDSFAYCTFRCDWPSPDDEPYAFTIIWPSRDSFYVNNSFFWDDSTSTCSWSGGAMVNLSGNTYDSTLQYQDNVMPTAIIVSDVDSGTIPLTVKFTATGSSDPDGSITTYYWNMGDSMGVANWPRNITHDDTITYTYSEIGNYHVELMVVDNYGNTSWASKYIKAKPSSGTFWFSAWIKDRNPQNDVGYFKKKIIVDGDTIYNQDIAGNGTWEHVVADISSEVGAADSVTIEFILKCESNISGYWDPLLVIDDVHVFGGTVVDGDFEARATNPWSEASDGYGLGKNCWSLHSGRGAYFIWRNNTSHTAGQYGKLSQKIDILGQ